MDFPLQDLVRIDANTLVYTQPDSGWTGVAPLQDLVAFADVRSLNLPANAVLTLDLETAPVREDLLFRPMVTGIDLVQVLSGLVSPVVKVLLFQNPTVPVLRWVRWKLTLSNIGALAPWDATFRILVCGSQAGAR